MQLGKDIVKYRYAILLFFVVLLVVSAVLFPQMMKKVNYDFTSYLPDEYATNQGYEFMSENFNIHGDVEIGVHTTDETLVSETASALSAVDGVSIATWAGDMEALTEFGVYTEDSAEYQKLRSLFTDGDDWVILVTLEYPPSSQEAMTVYGKITDILDENFGDKYYCSGMTKQSAELYSGTVDEIWKYVLVAVALVVIILIFTTNSIMEPLILLLTIGISIVINLGTNVLFESTSIVTFACSAILQLGLSMDYAIFLLHQYRHELETHLDPKEAMAAAIPKSAKAIFASALTTVGGLLALACMQFRIGPDLGFAVAKGIGLSFLTVLLLQPCLMLILDKARVKTTHKCLNFKYKQAIKHSIRDRKWVALVFLPILLFAVTVNVPGLPWSLKYTYVHFMAETEPSAEMAGAQAMATEMGNQVIIAVPCYSYEEDEYGDVTVRETYINQNYDFVEKLNEMKDEGKISFALGLFPMLPKGADISTAGFTISLNQAIRYVGEGVISDTMINQYIANGYTIYTVGINDVYDVESAESFAILDEINAAANSVFGELGTVYMTGYTQAAYDFAAVTPTDFMWVTVISVIIIFAILLFTLASFKYALMLVGLIECGIWINLLLQWVTSGGVINFMSYMIIGAVQLGATVDYAILIATRYREYRKRYAPRQASYMATTRSAMAITTSAAILTAATVTVALMSSNLIIQELCMLVARGAVISAVLVLFVLPAMLVIIDRRNGNELPIPRTPELRKWKPKTRTAKLTPATNAANIAPANEVISDMSITDGGDEASDLSKKS